MWTKGLTNNHALVIEDFDHHEETVKVRLAILGEEKPKKIQTLKTYNSGKGTFFRWKNVRYYFSEFMKI